MIAKVEKIVNIAIKMWLFLFCFGACVIVYDQTENMLVSMLYAIVENVSMQDVLQFLKGENPDDPANFVNQIFNLWNLL